jgi:Ca-activated chloride channel family protein
MNWLALSPAEVAAVWAALAALALWLYLHHRRPQHRRVSTLRFWASVQPIAQPRRRRLREPWALLAQVLFLLLLILALANPRWGVTFEGRSVVIVLDTSIWSQVRPARAAPWIDRERQEAQRLLDSLPSGDRVLLLPAEADAPPILPFTTDRGALRRAIAEARTSSGTADIPRALEMGRAALAGSRRGLLVYVGPGMLDEQQTRVLNEFREAAENPADNPGQPQFLVRLVGGETPAQNRGITRLSLRRDAAQPDLWHLLTQLKNYSDTKTSVVLKLSVGGQPLGQRTISLSPGELANAENEFTWRKGGLLQAEISPSDALGADDRAIVNLPTFRVVRVAVFANTSPFPTDLLTVLSSNPYLHTDIVTPAMNVDVAPDVAIYQGSSLPAQTAYNSIWFLSGQASAASHAVRVVGWNSQHPVTRWVRTHDVSVRNPALLTVLPGDTVLASTEGNPPAPLILAREQNGHRLLIIGFDPHNSNFPLQSAFPLLMAGGMEWMTHSVDESAESLSTGELDLPGPATRIVSPSGKDVPFARKGQDVHLLATETGMYRVIGPNGGPSGAPSGETSVAVNTPLLPALRMTLTPPETAGVESEPFQQAGWDLWRWLVLLGIVALWLEWWLYYSGRENRRAIETRAIPGDGELQNADQEFERTAEQSPEQSQVRKPNFVRLGG